MVTINPFAKDRHTSTAQVRIVLNGESKFSKLDLADAYLQVELDEASGEMIVINAHQGL